MDYDINANRVPLKPCLMLMGVLLLLTLPMLAWLSQGGMSVDRYWNSQINLFVFWNQFCARGSVIWLNLTQLGDAFVLLPLLSFFIISRPSIWAALFGSIPLVALLIHGGKALAAVPRPAAVIEEGLIHIVGQHLSGRDSLPSGHTATVFVAGTVIMLTFFFAHRRPSRWYVLLSLFAVTTTLAISRVSVGAHWPLDVFFGALCGYLAGLSGIFLTQRFSGWWSWMAKSRYQHIHGLVLLLWSVSLIVVRDSRGSEAAAVHWLAGIVGVATALYLFAWHLLNKKPSFRMTFHIA